MKLTALSTAVLSGVLQLPAIATAADAPFGLNATDICVGNQHCVGRGLNLGQAEKFFGVAGPRSVKVDDGLTYACFKIGKQYVLAMYSRQGRASVQPEQLDVSTYRQADCVGAREATQNLAVGLLPIALGAPEQSVVAKFGPPAETWRGPKPAYEIQPGQHALVYRSADKEQFVLVVIADEHVARVLGSIAP